MFDYIDKLRKKSDAEKNRFVMIVSVTVVSILFILWGISLAVKVNNGIFGVDKESSDDSDTPTLGETWKGFVEQMNDIIKRTPVLPEAASETGDNSTTNSATNTVAE